MREENYQERVMLLRPREDGALRKKLCEDLNQEPLRDWGKGGIINDLNKNNFSESQGIEAKLRLNTGCEAKSRLEWVE